MYQDAFCPYRRSFVNESLSPIAISNIDSGNGLLSDDTTAFNLIECWFITHEASWNLTNTDFTETGVDIGHYKITCMNIL